MKIVDLKPEFKISDQVLPQDFAEIKKKGIKTLICNRPDNEGADQPAFKDLEAEAERHGIKAYYFPVEVGSDPSPQVREVKQLYSNMQKPILAFCRSGTRSMFIHKGLVSG